MSSGLRPTVSFIVPILDEEETVEEIINRVRRLTIPLQIVAVDDGSSDGTPQLLAEMADRGLIQVVTHSVNRGKGAAIRSGIAVAEGEIVLIQDADLEYDPSDVLKVIEPMLDGRAEVVFGSRFSGEIVGMMRWHRFGNRFVTRVFNLLYGTRLTDLETCYKAMPLELLRDLDLQADRWGIDPEIACKITKRGHVILEVPIHYEGRSNPDGKKLRWKDGFQVVWTMVRLRYSD